MVEFDEVRRGYDKNQVDAYIQIINEEYQKNLTEYEALEEKLETFKNDNTHIEAIAAALINAEKASKQVVANAQIEARRINDEAKLELVNIDRIKREIMEDIKHMADRLNIILDKGRPRD